jgi:hypothetical protein
MIRLPALQGPYTVCWHTAAITNVIERAMQLLPSNTAMSACLKAALRLQGHQCRIPCQSTLGHTVCFCRAVHHAAVGDACESD